MTKLVTNKKLSLVPVLTAVLILGLPGCNDENKVSSTANTPFRTHLIHINDHHSHLAEEDYDLIFDGVETRVKLGGFARVASKIKALRNRLANPLVLHGGDALQGTLYYTLFKGDADVKLMNTVGFDAFALGNHEFDDGNAVLANFLKQGKFQAIAANIDFSQSEVLKGLVEPYLIKEVGGEQVGLIGIDTLKTLYSSSPGDDLSFSDEVETATKMVKELEGKGINKIILMTHYGYSQDLALAKQVAGVDVIVSADSHTLLGDLTDLGLNPKGPYPTLVTSPRGEPVCIAQAWQYSYAVGSLSVAFDEKGVVTECEGNPILLVGDSFQQRNADGNRAPVDAETQAKIEAIIAKNPNIEIVEGDPVVAEQLAEYTVQVEEAQKTVIGQAADDLLHIYVPGSYEGVTLPDGSQIAPVVAESFLWQLNSRNYDADLVILNAGGVRVAIYKGDITIETAYTVLPFSNTLYVLEMTGAEVKQVLEDALSNYLDKGGSYGSFPYPASIRYTIEATRPINQRVTLLDIRDKNGKWSSIDPAKMYKVGTISFLASGQDGYTTFSQVLEQGKGINSYFEYAESFVNYVKEVGTLTRPEETGVTYIK
ncbi:MAG: NAD nucleotidase [Candidatus Parabeggiatoa sp. nov. 2]|nr:MAG: NAD nucleotidase [Beggiatoa sp. 4572_84]RKZ57052.1 MAG: NAD nucleotidase [Gammaproteobacteria bacterium]